MATVTEAEPITGELIAAPNTIRAKFEINEGEIIAMTKRVESLVVADKQSRALAWEDRQLFRKLRLSVKKREESLTEEAKAQIKSVKEVANVLLGMLTPGEDAIVAKIEFYDAMQERAKKEAEEAKKLAVKKRLDALLAVGAMVHPLIVEEWDEGEFQSELQTATHAFGTKRIREQEEAEKAARMEAERLEVLRIEQEKIVAERAELERLKEEQEAIEWERRVKAKIEEERIAADKAAEQAKIDEANRIERDAIEAERKAVQAERDRLAREEFARQAKIQADADEAKRVEWEAKEAAALAEHNAMLETKRIEKEQVEVARLEALKPDIEKIRAFGDVLRLLTLPECTTKQAVAFVDRLRGQLEIVSIFCEEFE